MPEDKGEGTSIVGPTKVRVAAKALIVNEQRLLTVKVRDLLEPSDFYYGLPGGGQQPGENLHDALMRECEEEIGVPVHVGELLFARDYIGFNHRRAAVDGRFHQVELIFSCTLTPGTKMSDVGNGVAPDVRQIGVEWIPLERLLHVNFRPEPLARILQRPNTGRPVLDGGPVYLGDVD